MGGPTLLLNSTPIIVFIEIEFLASSTVRLLSNKLMFMRTLETFLIWRKCVSVNPDSLECVPADGLSCLIESIFNRKFAIILKANA